MNGWQAEGSARVLTVLRVALVLGWTLGIGYVALGSVVDHPLRASVPERQNLLALSPQGWAFFTRNPREAQEQIYRLDGDRWQVFGYPNTSSRNLFGVRRQARGLTVEAQALAAQVPAAAWRDCTAATADCLAAATVVRAHNRSALQGLCGELALVRREPVPWAWSSRAERIEMPGRVLRLEVSCGSERTEDEGGSK